MNVNYKPMVNKIALNVLSKSPEIPDYHLMVGSAESLDSVPVLVFKDYAPPEVSPVMAVIKNMSEAEIEQAIKDGILTVDDVIDKTYFMGNAIE